MVHIFSQQKSLKDLSIYGNKASLCVCAQGFTEKAQLRQAAGQAMFAPVRAFRAGEIPAPTKPSPPCT